MNFFNTGSSNYITGQTPQVGDMVEVKLDTETYATVKAVRGDDLMVAVECDYTGREVEVEVFASSCWLVAKTAQ